METQAVLDDCGINSPSSLIDDIGRAFDESRARQKEEDEQKKIIEKARQLIWNTPDGNETSPSPQESQFRFLRQDFHKKLADAIEELTVVTLAAVLEADCQLQIWRREMAVSSRSRYISKARVSGKDAPMPSVFRVNIEDRQATLPVFLSKRPNGRLSRRKLQEQRSDAIFLAQLKAAGKNALERALEEEKVSDAEFDQLWTEFQKPPRQLDTRYFYQGGLGFCEFARTRAVQSKPKDSKKNEKNKRKRKQTGK